MQQKVSELQEAIETGEGQIKTLSDDLHETMVDLEASRKQIEELVEFKERTERQNEEDERRRELEREALRQKKKPGPQPKKGQKIMLKAVTQADKKRLAKFKVSFRILIQTRVLTLPTFRTL